MILLIIMVLKKSVEMPFYNYYSSSQQSMRDTQNIIYIYLIRYLFLFFIHVFAIVLKVEIILSIIHKLRKSKSSIVILVLYNTNL